MGQSFDDAYFRRAQINTRDLTAYWKLDDAANTNVYDTISNYLGVTTSAEPAAGVGVPNVLYPNNASMLSGSQYINCGTPTAVQFSNVSFTVMAWLKPSMVLTPAKEYPFFGNASTYTAGWYGELNSYVTTGYTFAVNGVQISYLSDGLYNTNSWVHYAGVRNVASTSLTLYINGTLVKSAVNSTFNNSCNQSSFMIGKSYVNGGPVKYTGLIDDVRLYKRALTSNEIKAIASGFQ